MFRFSVPAVLCLMCSLLLVGAPNVFAIDTPASEGKNVSEKVATTTLENLQAAYTGESNANARYLAFAKKADEDSYGAVASLFRAAAAAEKIHADAHAAVIRTLGGEPKAKMEPPVVKTTAENLKAAIEGETYERDVMYPEFIKIAKAEKKTAAIKTFTYARTAEGGHAQFYKDFLAKLDKLKGSGKKDFYVCTICGNTVTEITFEKCPSCFEPKDKYITVN